MGKNTLVPLLGPIGGGFGAALGASVSSVVVVAAGAAAASSDAFTTSLELLLVFFKGKETRPVLEAGVVFPTLGVNINPVAADAMLQLAIESGGWRYYLCVFEIDEQVEDLVKERKKD